MQFRKGVLFHFELIVHHKLFSCFSQLPPFTLPPSPECPELARSPGSVDTCWVAGWTGDTEGGECWPPLRPLSLSHHPQHLSGLLHHNGLTEGTITVQWNRRMIALFNNEKERWDPHWVVFLLFLLSMAGITTLIQLGSNMFIAMDRITIGTFYTQSAVYSLLGRGLK